jgi:hypothetical protein
MQIHTVIGSRGGGGQSHTTDQIFGLKSSHRMQNQGLLAHPTFPLVLVTRSGSTRWEILIFLGCVCVCVCMCTEKGEGKGAGNTARKLEAGPGKTLENTPAQKLSGAGWPC